MDFFFKLYEFVRDIGLETRVWAVFLTTLYMVWLVLRRLEKKRAAAFVAITGWLSSDLVLFAVVFQRDHNVLDKWASLLMVVTAVAWLVMTIMSFRQKHRFMGIYGLAMFIVSLGTAPLLLRAHVSNPDSVELLRTFVTSSKMMVALWVPWVFVGSVLVAAFLSRRDRRSRS